MIYCNKNCLHNKDGECSKDDCSFLGSFSGGCPYCISLNAEEFEKVKDAEDVEDLDTFGNVFDHASLR